MDERLFQRIYTQFGDDDLNRIFKAKKISKTELETKKRKVEYLTEQAELCNELLNNLDLLKGCSINPLLDSIYRIDDNLVNEFRDCTSIPNFLSLLYKFSLLKHLPIIISTTKFSKKYTSKNDKLGGKIKYSNIKENLDKIKIELSKLIEEENKRRNRHIQIKDVKLLEDQKIMFIDLLIEEGKRHFRQFGFRQSSNPKDYILKGITIYPVNQKEIKINYSTNESTTTISNHADYAFYKKIVKHLYSLQDDENISPTQYLTHSKDTKEIKEIIEKRRKDTITEIKKKKPLSELDKKRLNILQNIKIREIGINAKDAPFEGEMHQLTLIGDDFRKLIKSMKLEEVMSNLFEKAREIDVIIEYNDQSITITREKWEGRGLSELEKEIIEPLLRKE